MVAVLIAGCFVFFPYCVKDKDDKVSPSEPLVKKNKKCGKSHFFSVLNCFAAGMLISMSLVHVLPESSEMYN